VSNLALKPPAKLDRVDDVIHRLDTIEQAILSLPEIPDGDLTHAIVVALFDREWRIGKIWTLRAYQRCHWAWSHGGRNSESAQEIARTYDVTYDHIRKCGKIWGELFRPMSGDERADFAAVAETFTRYPLRHSALLYIANATENPRAVLDAVIEEKLADPRYGLSDIERDHGRHSKDAAQRCRHCAGRGAITVESEEICGWCDGSGLTGETE